MKLRSLIDESGRRSCIVLHADIPEEQELLDDLVSDLLSSLKDRTGCSIKDRYKYDRRATRKRKAATRAALEERAAKERNTRSRPKFDRKTKQQHDAEMRELE